MQETTAANRRAGWLARVLRPDKAAEIEQQDVRSRLAAMARPEGIALLEELFARQQSVRTGVDATRFRIDFEGQRDEIDRLRRWFIDEDRQAKPVYRAALIALAVIGNERAKRLLALIDRLLRLLKEEFRRDPGREITLAEMSETLGEDQADIAEALAYLVDNGPVGGAARTTGYPENGEWQLTPHERFLDFGTLDAVLEQWAEWAGRNPEGSPFGPEAQLNGEAPEAQSGGFWPWMKRHWARVTLIGTVIAGVIGFLAKTATVVDFFKSLLGAE